MIRRSISSAIISCGRAQRNTNALVGRYSSSSCSPSFIHNNKNQYRQMASASASASAAPSPSTTNNNAASTNTSFCRVFLASEVANQFKDDVAKATAAVTAARGKKPKLVGFLATDSAPSIAYAESTRKACEAVGIEYELRKVDIPRPSNEDGSNNNNGNSSNPSAPSQAGFGEVEEKVLEANQDPDVNGIMVYYPMFGGRQDQYIQQVVAPTKDVEGLNFTYLFNLYHNVRYIDPVTLQAPALPSSSDQGTSTPQNEVDYDKLVKSILPCTPLGIVKILETIGVYNSVLPYGQRAFGKTVTVINRSEVVGRPLAALLANDGARVFSADLDGVQEFNRRKVTPGSKFAATAPHHTVTPTLRTLDHCLSISDVVISGVPSPEYKIETDHLKDGLIAVNFASGKNFVPDEIKQKASIYVPAVGKVTINMLQRNLLRLVDYQDRIQGKKNDAVAAAVNF